jgi:2-haloacid dehalogenase
LDHLHYRVVVFDAYGTLFDVYSVTHLAETLFPAQGAALAALWRDKQIEYTRLISQADPCNPAGSQHYLSFWEITQRALRYSLQKLKLVHTQTHEATLMGQYAQLSPFPENKAVLEALKVQGIPCAILSNGSPEMLASAVASAGFEPFLDRVISVDAARQFKISPATYQLVLDHYPVAKSEVLFVSSNGWDAAGASWFGFTTCWINRTSAPLETIGPPPDFVGSDLTAVLRNISHS